MHRCLPEHFQFSRLIICLLGIHDVLDDSLRELFCLARTGICTFISVREYLDEDFRFWPLKTLQYLNTFRCIIFESLRRTVNTLWGCQCQAFTLEKESPTWPVKSWGGTRDTKTSISELESQMKSQEPELITVEYTSRLMFVSLIALRIEPS